jgi:hypothetical protein
MINVSALSQCDVNQAAVQKSHLKAVTAFLSFAIHVVKAV